MMAIATLVLAWVAGILTAVGALHNATGHNKSDLVFYLAFPLWATTAILAGIPQGLLSPWWPVALLMLAGTVLFARDCVADIAVWRKQRRLNAVVLDFLKEPGSRSNIPRGRWKRGRIDGMPTAQISCPICCRVSAIRGAVIVADGPHGLLRFNCGHCDFNRRIRLVQWQYE
jgi:hypothetical protein